MVGAEGRLKQRIVRLERGRGDSTPYERQQAFNRTLFAFFEGMGCDHDQGVQVLLGVCALNDYGIATRIWQATLAEIYGLEDDAPPPRSPRRG